MAEKDYIVNLEDLKYVNDKIGDLKSAVDDSLLTDLSVTWNATNAYIKIADGTFSGSQYWKRTDMVAIPEGAKGLYYTCPVSSNDLQVQVVASVAFYSTDNPATSYISTGSAGIKSGTTNGLAYTYLPVPATAKYMRLSVFADFASSYVMKYATDAVAEINDLEAQLNDTAIVDNQAALLTSTASKVLVMNNDHLYGDGGPCWFGIMDGYTAHGIVRNDGSVVYPLPDQSPLEPTNAPYNKIMKLVKSYVGNTQLVYGATNTMYQETCTNEIDCSTFATAVINGVTYENSRYIAGNTSNKIGEFVGDTRMKLNYGWIPTYQMAQWFAMHKQLYTMHGNSNVAVNQLQFGDILFQHADETNDNDYYGIGHVQIVIGTIPSASAVIVAQGGGGGNVNNEETAVKTSCRIISIADMTHYYPVFARPNYGKCDTSSDTLFGKHSLTTKTGLKLQLDTSINNTGVLTYSQTFSATTDYIPVPSNGRIVYNGELTGLDSNHSPYMAMIFRYDANKNFISSNGILTVENGPVTQLITKPNQTTDTCYIRIIFGHTTEQNLVTSLADLDRFSAEITSVTTITCGTGKDYTSLVSCLDYVTSDALRNTWDENNRLVIKLDAGTFSMNAIADLYNQNSTRYKWGLYIPRCCTIQGAGKDKTFITYDYSGSDDWILGHLAPFNMPYESEMRDLTITAKNCRYCVHSDGDEPFGRTWAQNNNKIHVENVKMIHQGYSSGNNPTYNTPSAWGSGIRSGVTREFINCEFIAYHMPWFCHNTIGQDAPSYVLFNNCKFINKKEATMYNIGNYESVAFISWGTGEKTYIKMENCYLNRCAYIRNATTYNQSATCDYYLDSDGFEFVAESGTNNAHLLDTWCNRNCVLAVADQAVTGYKPVTVTVNGSAVAYSAGTYQHGIAINSCDADGTAVVQTKGCVNLPRLGITGRSVGDLLGYSGGAWVIDSSNPIIKVLDAYIGEIV